MGVSDATMRKAFFAALNKRTLPLLVFSAFCFKLPEALKMEETAERYHRAGISYNILKRDYSEFAEYLKNKETHHLSYTNMDIARWGELCEKRNTAERDALGTSYMSIFHTIGALNVKDSHWLLARFWPWNL